MSHPPRGRLLLVACALLAAALLWSSMLYRTLESAIGAATMQRIIGDTLAQAAIMLSSADRSLYAKRAHTLPGMAGTVGLPELAAAPRALEHACAAGSDPTEALARIEAALARARCGQHDDRRRGLNDVIKDGPVRAAYLSRICEDGWCVAIHAYANRILAETAILIEIIYRLRSLAGLIFCRSLPF